MLRQFREEETMNKLRHLSLDKNEVHHPEGGHPHRKKSSSFLKLVVFILLAIGVVVFLRNWWAQPSGSSVFNYVLGKESAFDEDRGRVNILLLGMAGGKHDGATLTDTIMVASYDLKTNKVVLISLPRDVWITEHKAKINTLYQIGLGKNEGLKFAREEIGQKLGLKIPYAIRIDFAGFVKAVDLVEGVDVNVERSFDDYFYPIEGKENDLCDYKEDEKEFTEEEAKELSIKPGRVKVLLDKEGKVATSAAEPGKNIVYTDEQSNTFFACRFEHLSFKKGLAHMDGVTALKFVRSRHGLNGEGSDFARSRRQQLALQSFKGKVLSLDTFLAPGRVIGLVKTLEQSIDTDIPQSKYLEFAKLIKKMESSKSIVIDASGEQPLLITPTEGNFGGAWVLMPPGDDFTRIQQYVTDSFIDTLGASESAKISPVAPVK